MDVRRQVREAALLEATPLVRGASWPAAVLPVFSVGLIALLHGNGQLRSGADTVVFVCLLLGIGALGGGITWWMSAGMTIWETPEALVARRRPGRWVRVPWADVHALTWLNIPRVATGPAVTTVGGRYDRPNPDWFTSLGEPMLVVGGRSAATAALRAAAERHGVRWVEQVEQRWVEGSWTSTRWDW